MNNKAPRLLRVLLVGVGNRGRWTLERCTREAGWEIAGLVDREPRHLDEARALTGLGESACFDDLESALADTEPDAVILCTPTVTHAKFAKAAMSAGAAVLTEKGMATNWAEAVDLVSFVREVQGIFAVAQNYRYDGISSVVGSALGATDEADVPRVEEPFLVDYVQHRVRPVPGTLTYPFASVWDMSCHHFDNLLCWLGPVAEVTAHACRAPWSPYEHEGNTSALLRFANGVAVNYVHTHDAARNSLRIEVHGRNGALVVRDGRAEFSERPEVNFGQCPVQEIAIPAFCSEVRMLADFRDYVTTGCEPGISGYRNLETMALCEMTVRSALEKRTVRREELNS
jgi:predicted dehydrogenase